MSNDEKLQNNTEASESKTPPRDWRAMASRNPLNMKMSEYIQPEEVRKLIEEAKKDGIPSTLKLEKS